ncbi:MAG: aminotransferase class V-fold PLP-dependent enzyme [bacterium]|nr:aminotransferase class V-fold PLP-dependent enzyme [bacterium]
MKTIYFTPGPSQLYPTVKRHMIHALNHNIGSISHRSNLFQKIFQETTDSLRQLLQIPQTHSIFFLSSSLESMERIIQNCVKTNSVHFVNGAFSRKFYEIALQLDKKPQKIEVADGNGFSFQSITLPSETELVCITQNETSTGVQLPMEDIYYLKKKYPNVLFALDIVSSAPYVSVDYSKIDISFFSVQKGFGLPSGLGVLIVNEKAIQKSHMLSKTDSIGSYHSFIELKKMADIYQTPETPNVLGLYLLGKVCKDILKKGLKSLQIQTDKKAQLLYSTIDKSRYLKPFVQNKSFQSATTIVANITNIQSKYIIGTLNKKGFVIGKGYGKYKNHQIRIANFPAHSLKMIAKLCSSLNEI